MTDDEEVLERERARSFEIGHISMLEDLAGEFRERAGKVWAEAGGREGIAQARQLKSLANEMESRAEKRREEWEAEYHD